MRILRKKNITNETVADAKIEPAQVDLEPVVDHTTANTIASKEANEEAAQKNIEESGIEKVAKEVVDSIQDPKKDTPAPKTPSLKPYTEAKQVANRKELGALIRESSEAGRVYRIKRSLEEGFRYVFEDFEKEYPECYFVCHSDEDANNENGYFDTEEDAKAYAAGHPEICCIFKVCDGNEEKIWTKEEIIECDKKPVSEDVVEDPELSNVPEVEPGKEEVIDQPDVEEIPESFDGRMDFLAADEQEAIDGYDKVIALLGEEDASVKEQLEKIRVEEIAHKDFLEAVKSDKALVYGKVEEKHSEEEPELAIEDEKVVVDEDVDPTPNHTRLERLLNQGVIDRVTVCDALLTVVDDDTIGDLIDTYEWEYVEESKKNEIAPEAAQINEEEKHVCPECGKEPCECKKEGVVNEENNLKEAVIEPVLDPEEKVTVEVTPEAEATIATISPELDPEAEIEIDSIETFEPTDEVAKSTMTTIKDAGDGAMFAFKDTLKDLYNLKIKVSDLQQLLSSSSNWLLDLLGFNHDMESEIEINSEEIPEEPVPVEAPEIVGDVKDDVAPITDLSTVDINDFDEVEPIDYEEEDEKFFVED